MSHKHIPNYLTLARIILIPIFVLFFYLPWQPWGRDTAAVIFTLACITDWLDGYLARKWQVTSPMGAFLDPVADKILVSTALVCILAQPTVTFLVLPVAIIIGREIVVSALREWMAELGARATVAVGNLGKIKTTMQMVAIILLVLHDPDTSTILGIIGFILIYLAALLTLWSMILYLKLAWPQLINKNS